MKMKKTTTKIKSSALVFAFAPVFAFLNFACEPASLRKTNSSAPATNATSSAEINAAALENDLQTMRNADFDFVYVFRRKDGGALDGEDKKFLRANSPAATNRFVLSDGNRAAIAGSSFRFEPQNLEKLGERFTIENLSKPEAQNSNSENKNAPAESNTQQNSNR